MDTGLQWDIRVHLEDCDWRKWVSRTGRFLAVPMFMLLFMITPAHAVVETMTPTGGGYYTLDYMGGSYSTPCAACEAWFKSLGPGGYAYNCSIAGDMDGAYCGARIVGHDYSTSLTARYVAATCPVPSVNPLKPYVYNRATGLCVRTIQSCPAHSSGTYPDACVCDSGYKVDAAKTSCVPMDCPVTALTPFPPPNDACSAALENLSSTQAQKNAACGTLTPAMQTGQTCLENKLAAMTPAAIPFARTADIRSVAYQAHFREIWDKMERLVALENDPAKRAACAARRAEIAAEKGCDSADACEGACYAPSATQRSHCFRGKPARPDPNGAKHTQGNAIDVSQEDTIDPLLAALAGRNPPQTITQFLDAAPNCNLKWGGTFTDNVDEVHFEAR